MGVRAAEIAELTGTTVRTVRYYHSLGLLPVPPQRGGWRDYGLGHVARLSRIRWLVQAGVPLESIGRILNGDAPAGGTDRAGGGPHGERASSGGGGNGARGTDDRTNAGTGGRTDDCADDHDGEAAGRVAADLAGALEAVERSLAEATRQREMLICLLERAREGLTVSPMTPRMAAFFDRLEAAAPDERTRAAVRRERDVVELACYRGQMPPEAEALFRAPQPQEEAGILEAYGQDASAMSDEQIEERVRANIRRLESMLGPLRARALARSVDREAVRAFFRLASRVEPFDARMGAAMERGLLAAIDRWSAEA